MKKSITIIILFIAFFLNSQNKVKIDSVFNRNFYILEIELFGSKNFETDKTLFFDEIILDDNEKVYISKYLDEAVDFFETITQIPAPIKHRSLSLSPYVDEKTLQDWKNWYALNRKKIRWCKKEKKVYLR